MKTLQLNRFFILVPLFLCCFMSNDVIGQKNLFLDGIEASDLRVWYGIRAKIMLGDTTIKDPNKNLFSLLLKTRINRNSFSNVISIHDFGLERTIVGDLTFGTSLRVLQKVDEVSLSLYSDLSLKKEIPNTGIKFRIRGRYQRVLAKFNFEETENILVGVGESIHTIEHRFRPKFKL